MFQVNPLLHKTMFKANPLLAKQRIHMKNQVLFSSKDKSKKLKCLLQFLFGASRIKYMHGPGCKYLHINTSLLGSTVLISFCCKIHQK